jgi:hypothetical protein
VEPIITAMLARLDVIEKRLDAHRLDMQREWGQARDQRDALGRELDAFNVEMLLVQVDLKRLRDFMPQLSPNSAEINAAVDTFVATTKALVSDDRAISIEPFARALGNLIAVVNGAAAQMAASAVVAPYRSLEARIDRQDEAIADLKQRVVGDASE